MPLSEHENPQAQKPLGRKRFIKTNELYMVLCQIRLLCLEGKNINFTNKIGTDLEKTERLTALAVQGPKHMCVAY